MEKQHQQETNRLNQEIQQARTQHNTLQSQYDKVCSAYTAQHALLLLLQRTLFWSNLHLQSIHDYTETGLLPITVSVCVAV